MREKLKMDCPDSIGMGVRNESEWVSGMDWNHCPEWIGMGVRNGAEYAHKKAPYGLEIKFSTCDLTSPM